ncbi:PIG-L deacetylase family protein [Streptomyces sp. NPDC057654]|uniref:PIG-L deacetylase family protein n=1 Tax=Streptomyces sp. NPDC057654 TaxID=3346196 RepID=UPI0036A5482F
MTKGDEGHGIQALPHAQKGKSVRVLALGAHPDDVELLCAGTLAHYARQGAQVTVAIFTDGALGSGAPTPAGTAALREAEARRAADVLGAELVWLGLPDGFLYDTRETRTRTVDVLRRARPDIVFAHHPDDYHPDHQAASRLAAAARLLARERALVTGHPATAAVPPLFHLDTLAATHGAPDLWVDITTTMGVKEAMLMEHVSQNSARRARKGSDFVDLARQQAARRGRQADVRYAEAFVCAPAHPATSAADLTPPGITLPYRLASASRSRDAPGREEETG